MSSTRLSMAALDDLLVRTSRTFALSIPRLPSPLREEVTVAYLLFRVADTLEDAEAWERDQRLVQLRAFREALQDFGRAPDLVSSWREAPPSSHGGTLDLLNALPGLLDAAAALEPAAREIVLHHAGRTASGMEHFVSLASPDGSLKLGDRSALEAYCYAVAGIVGELLTDLFLLREPVGAVEGILLETAVAFGEGLQLVNILKDAADDASQGRFYLPPDLSLAAVFERARFRLVEARRYVAALQRAGASAGTVAFCALPVHLAEATLIAIESDGPGARIGRERVAGIVAEVETAVASGHPVC